MHTAFAASTGMQRKHIWLKVTAAAAAPAAARSKLVHRVRTSRAVCAGESEGHLNGPTADAADAAVGV